MRTPKPPTGFIPVDSEEAKQFGVVPTHTVNVAFLKDGVWIHGRDQYCEALHLKTKYPNAYQHLHVQLPPKVEWEEVWTVDTDRTSLDIAPDPIIRRNGDPVCSLFRFTKEERDTIVAALNKMEDGNG